MPAAFFDFFRKVVLKSTDGVTVETEIEADSFTDELNIIRGNGVAFNGDNATDTFSIDVDYTLDIPLGTTDLVLTDVNSGTSTVQLIEGNNIQLTRISASELRIDGADLTVSITNASQANPVVITSGSVHGLANGASITIQDVAGMTELNGNSYFVSVVNSTQFELYTDSARTVSLDGTSFSGYISGGSIQIENTATLAALLDVEIPTAVTNDVLVYNGTDWVDSDTVTLSTANITTLNTDDINAVAGLSITSAAGNNLVISNGADGFFLSHDNGNIQVTTAGSLNLNGTTVTIGDGTNTIDVPDGTTVDLTGVTVTGAGFDLTGDVTGDVVSTSTSSVVLDTSAADAVFTGNVTGDLTGNADTTTLLQSARTFEILGGFITADPVSFDGSGNVQLNAEIDNNAVVLGVKTSGSYVSVINGTANEIEVAGSGSETASVTLSLPTSMVVPGSLTVTSDLIVNGTTTTVNTTDLDVTDNTIKLNKDEVAAGVTAGTSGIEIERGTADNARFVWNETLDTWSPELWDGAAWNTTTLTASEFIGSLTGDIAGNLTGNVVSTNTSSVVLDTSAADAVFTGNVTGNVTGNADTATAWAASIDLSLFGEVTSGTHSVDGSGNVIISDTVIPNFAERAVDATAAALAAGTHTGVTITYDDPGDNLSVTVNNPVITIDGAVAGNATMTDLGDITITVSPVADAITLGTDTTGSFVKNLVAGTGVTLDLTTGEDHTPMITIENLPNSSLDNSAITITDTVGPTSQVIDLGETIQFAGDGGYLEVEVAATNSINFSHADSIVTAGTYGSATELATFVVDSKGHITGASNVSMPDPTLQITGAITASGTFTNLGDMTMTATLQATTDNLADVDLSGGVASLATGDVLEWNGSNWVPSAIGGAAIPGLQAVTNTSAASTNTVTLSNTTADGSGPGLVIDEMAASGATLIVSAGFVTFSGNLTTTTGTMTATQFIGDTKGDVLKGDGTIIIDSSAGEMDYSFVTNGPVIEQSASFYLDAGTPLGSVTGSSSIGKGYDSNSPTELGEWVEIKALNTVANNFGPTNSQYDGKLTGITWNETLGGFNGFAQGSTYDIDITLLPNFTVSANQLVRFDLEAFSSSNKIMADAGDTLVLENVDKASAVKARILVTFEDATPANNYFTITNSDGDNQNPQYFIEEGWVRITKIS